MKLFTIRRNEEMTTPFPMQLLAYFITSFSEPTGFRHFSIQQYYFTILF